ncbi:phenylalanine hydroxylase-like protein, partial [Euroglyphus maynei]
MGSHRDPVHIIFSMKDGSKVGSLADALKIFKDFNINLYRIESRSSKRFDSDYEFLIECSSHAIGLNEALDELKRGTQYLQIISRDKDNDETVPWFPRKIKDLDRFANHILSYGSELDADHP